MESKLGKGIIAVLIANVIHAFVGIASNFILPRYLSVESYAAIKTFQLYTSYVGVFALGYSDGMYLEYGGKDMASVDRQKLKISLSTIRLFLIAESIILLTAAHFIQDKIIFAFTLTVFSQNLIWYYKNLYQAVGEFKRYSFLLNIYTVLIFVVNISLVFLIKTDDYYLFLIGYVIVCYIIWLGLEIYSFHFFKGVQTAGVFSGTLLIHYIRKGFFLLVGNFSSILFTSMDRWFVKALMDAIAFAHYSFAVSLENFLNLAVSPVTVTMYHYFCRKNDEETVNHARRYILIFSALLMSSAFVLEWIVRKFISNYTDAVDVLFILLAAQIFFIPNKAIYVNLYKAAGKQKLYFFRLMITLVAGAALNYVFYAFLGEKEAFAYATLVSSFIWIAFSCLDFGEYKVTVNEVLFSVGIAVSILLLGKALSPIPGLLIYLSVLSGLAYILLRDDMIRLLNWGKSRGILFLKRNRSI